MPEAPVRVGAVIVAAGSGVRFGDRGKVFAPLGGRPILAWSVECFARQPRIARVVVVLGEHTQAAGVQLLEQLSIPQVAYCTGGATRSDSVRAGLAFLDDCDVVLVHDAARPLVSATLIDAVLDATLAHGAAVPVLPVRDTIYRAAADGHAAETVDRNALRAAQTPQGACVSLLRDAFDAIHTTTDEGSLLLASGKPPILIDGDPANLKITYPEDIALADALLTARKRGS